MLYRVRSIGRIPCDELKASSETRHIKIILISAKYSSIQSENAGYKSCDHFIEKPFDIEDLSDTVKRSIAVSQQIFFQISQGH